MKQLFAATSVVALLFAAPAFAQSNPAGQANTAGQPTAQVAVPAPHINVQEPAPHITVKEPAPSVAVTEPKPEVAVTEPKPEVTVTEPKPNVAVQEAKPTVTVTEQKPAVTVVKKPEVAVASVAAAPAAAPKAAPPPLAANAKHLIGKQVYGLDHNDIGTISNIIVGPEGHVDGVLVQFGGFLGVGPRQVAIKWDHLSVLPNNRIMVNMTKADAYSAPNWVKNKPPATFAEAHLLNH